MFDVVIIGAGVAGDLLADQLSQVGVRVLVLEAGLNDQNRAALVDNFLSDRAAGPYPQFPQLPATQFIQKGPDQFSAFANYRVGGTTWMWLGSTPRFVANDFKTKTLYGYGEDWPISYEDLAPWYNAAEKALGVAFDFPQSCVDKWVNAKIKGHSYDNQQIHFSSTPQARNPHLCCGNGICVPICPVQAKYDATIHINKALKQGATLIPQAVVFKLHADSHGHITQVSYYDWDKNVHTATGKYFILATHGVETPKLLLHSANEYFVNGLANHSDQVGRNLMDHPCQLSAAQTLEKIYPYRGPQQTSGFWGFRDSVFRKDFMPYYVAIQNSGEAWPKRSPYTDVDAALEQNLFGEKLEQHLREQLNRQLVFCGMCEQIPNPNNRISLSRSAFDYYGLPKIEISYSYSDKEQRAFAHMRSLFDSMFNHVKATAIHHFDKIQTSCHIIGTARMGHHPKTSVVNANCQAHEHDNLFIAGSSVFPTSGTANPTLTLCALALRLADYLQKNKLDLKRV